MHNEWLLFLFLLLVIAAAIDIMRRAVMVILRDQRRQELQKIMRKLRRPALPHVSVLVYAKRSTDAVEATLQSLRKNRYGSFDVVVVNDVSNKRLYSAPPRLEVSFLKRRVASSKLDAYRAAYKKSRRGEIIMCLDAGAVLDPLCIKRAVALSGSRQQWHVSLEKVSQREGIGGVTSSLYGLLWTRPAVVPMYRVQAFRHKKEGCALREITWLPKTAVWGALLVGALCVSFVLGPAMLWYVWVVFSGYLLGLIWLKGGWSASQKVFHSFAVPSALFLLPVTSFIEAVFQLDARK